MGQIAKDPADVSRGEQLNSGIEDEVLITLEKRAGTTTFKRTLEASSASAALNGIAILVVEYAQAVQRPVDSVLALLATVMLAPAGDPDITQ